MSGVKLQRLDIPLDAIDLPTGVTVLGRGQLLQCGDKRISRTHADLKCECDGKVFLIPRHTNPCFKRESNQDKVLVNGKIVELKNGDVFSLLPDKFRYKVIFEQEDTVANGDDESSASGNLSNTHNGPFDDKSKSGENRRKRVLPDWLVNAKSPSEAKKSSPKKTKKAPTPRKSNPKVAVQADDTSAMPANAGTSSEKEVPTPRKSNPKVGVEDGDTSAMPPANAAISSDSDDENLADDAAKSENGDEGKPDNQDDNPVQKNTQVSASPSVADDDGSARRDPCQYGQDCYRQNAAHRREFSHPGDSDYVSEDDENDDRPECEYGLRCYRKNAQHKKMFKHTRKVQPKRAAAKRLPTESSDDDDVSDIDEYDLDDSFLTDDSDVYKPDSSFEA